MRKWSPETATDAVISFGNVLYTVKSSLLSGQLNENDCSHFVCKLIYNFLAY